MPIVFKNGNFGNPVSLDSISGGFYINNGVQKKIIRLVVNKSSNYLLPLALYKAFIKSIILIGQGTN